MKEAQRNKFLEEMQEEREKLQKEKEELALLMQDKLVKRYIALKDIIDKRMIALPRKMNAVLNRQMQGNCEHEIYVLVGYAYKAEDKWIDSSYFVGNYKHYVCLDCMQDVYISRRGAMEFEEKNMVIFLNDDVMSNDIINLRNKYIKCILEGNNTYDAYQKIR